MARITRHRPTNTDLVGTIAMMLGMVAFALTCLAAWSTHIVVCIKTASWALLIAGAIAAPIGIVHGVGVWFGLFG